MKWENRYNKSYCIENRELRIVLHRVINNTANWYLTCYKIDVNNLGLESEDLEEAKKEAVQIVYDKINRLKVMVTEIRDFCL